MSSGIGQRNKLRERKSRSTIYAPIKMKNRSTVVMRRKKVPFPFMDLPAELRCHVYSYLREVVYEPVYPEPNICSWEVYWMPTTILQVSKTIYEEAKHPLILEPSQKLDGQLVPKIVLGPKRIDLDTVHAVLSDKFHEAGKQLHTSRGGRLQECGDEIEKLGRELASWYNNTYLPLQVRRGTQEAFVTQTECRPERLHRFVAQTLKRMAGWNTCEIRVRFLVHPSGPPVYHELYEALTSMDVPRQALSSGLGRGVERVYLVRGGKRRGSKRILDLRDDMFRRDSGKFDIKVTEALARDWELLDLDESLR